MNGKEVLKSVDDYLYKLKDGIRAITELIQSGKEFEAINLIPQVSDGLDWINQALNYTKEYHLDNLNLSQINEFINEICEALENEDYILISDLFNYEIIPILESLHEDVKTYI